MVLFDDTTQLKQWDMEHAAVIITTQIPDYD